MCRGNSHAGSINRRSVERVHISLDSPRRSFTVSNYSKASMGSAQSVVSPEILTAGAVAAGTAVTAYGFKSGWFSSKVEDKSQASSKEERNQGAGHSTASLGAKVPGSKKSKKKAKAKSAKSATSANNNNSTSDTDEFDRVLAAATAENARAVPSHGAAPSRVVAFPDVVPGAFDSPEPDAASRPAPAGEKKPRKKKGKKGAAAASLAVPLSTVASTSTSEAESQPGSQLFGITSPENSIVHVVSLGATSAPISKKEKKRKGPVKTEGTDAPPAGVTPPSGASGISSSTKPSPIDTESWTRVGSRKRSAKQPRSAGLGESDPGLLTSDTNLTTSVTDNTTESTDKAIDDTDGDGEDSALSSPLVTENRRTFVEKMLPKPRRTGVEECVLLILISVHVN